MPLFNSSVLQPVFDLYFFLCLSTFTVVLFATIWAIAENALDNSKV